MFLVNFTMLIQFGMVFFMERSELYDWLERIIEVLGPEGTLEAIVRAMGSDELEYMLEFIDRVYEISAATS
jgi:hypothetical protein